MPVNARANDCQDRFDCVDNLQRMDSFPTRRTAGSSTCASAARSRFVDAGRECCGTRSKLPAAHRTPLRASTVARSGIGTKVRCRDVYAEGHDAIGVGDAAKSIKTNYTCRAGASGLFADPSSCSIYHWCVVGILHSTHLCAPGLHFSASASGCVLPKDAECEWENERNVNRTIDRSLPVGFR